MLPDCPDLEIPAFPERDKQGGDDLPTYDDLAAQQGPNSRFGRWRQWIEKRAAERYADLTPEEYERRRARGWGEGVDDTEQDSEAAPSLVPPLHIQTDFPRSEAASASPLDSGLEATPPLPATLIPESLSPARLNLYHFGSRFLPHAIAPIRCLLPILNDTLLLIGHDNGLSVLDMFPREWTDGGVVERGPNDAEARLIWEGEVVYQLTILEAESTGQGTPQGVVLALVGPDNDYCKDQEGIRSLRMYNLASLISLAKWSVSQKGSRPLDLRQSHAGKNYNTLPKRHRPQSSLTKNLKHLMSDPPIAQPQSPSSHISEQSSYSPVAEASASSSYTQTGVSEDSPESLSSWDVVDDLPLRWATHYTSLASAGSRLMNASVLFYELYRHEGQRGRGGALLAVATKSNIFLYEAPKGERAFHLIKEFYTPLTARSITFVQQSVQDTMARSSSDVALRSSGAQSNLHRHSRVISFGAKIQRFPQLSLFVVFEKKAGLIRIADSAVGEVEMYDEGYGFLSTTAMSNTSMNRKSRASWDGRGFSKEHKAIWIPPVKINLPAPANRPSLSHMYIVTRGKTSHIVPYPLPSNLSALPPYRSFLWSSPPTRISCRVCSSPAREGSGSISFLQLVAFGEDGVEVQEISLSSLSEQKGKRRAEQPVRSQSDLGGQTGFLNVGGHWHRPFYQIVGRSDSSRSDESASSLYDLSPDELVDRMQAEQGIYGWVQKGLEDWRVFWLGGSDTEHDLTKDYEL
ncbi:hypothetical protein SCP_0210140 [Sparassis crispa]|uniref:Uncharacterized protein n=1 Tax=Sparassis crispa TaxID=139825 RepID=A0A401GCG1_9APHY|nr:hypothetical protein SCP_0210140 [Sparassis crispa]GBE79813.1 hypothetical protein SCP_0210140 [Sparassis crispa]